MPQLPPGFVLENSPAKPSLPSGFELERQEPYSGTILPFSRDEQGNVSFDSNAGLFGLAKDIFGSAKSAATLPGDVFTGKVDPLSDEAIGRAVEFSAFASPLNPGIRAGDTAIPGLAKALRQSQAAAPSGQALVKEGGAGLKEVRRMGVDYDAAAVQDVADAIRSELYEAGFREQTAKTTHNLLNDLANPPEGGIATAADIMAARQAFRQAAKERGADFEPTPDAAAAMRVIEGLDRFLAEPPPGSVLRGPADAVSESLKRANANYAAGKRSGRLTGVGDKAERRAEASNSGQNIDNTIRQRIASLLESPKKTAGFDKAELDELEEVVRGTFIRNRARGVGNLLGGGGGLGRLLTGGAGAMVGGAAGGVAGGGIGAVALPALGISVKALANALTKRSLGKADEMVRKRSPLYQEMQQAMPLEAISPEKRAALIRALLLSQGDQQ